MGLFLIPFAVTLPLADDMARPAKAAVAAPQHGPRPRQQQATSAPAKSDSVDGDSTLKLAHLKTTDAALLGFFRKRVQPAPERGTIEKLAKDLGNEDIIKANAAQAELITLGACVAPVVREVANDVGRVEASTRARQVLEYVEGPQADTLPIGAARLLAARKPAGAAEALLGYLPLADNDLVLEELESALAAVAMRQGKADPAILAALKDPRAVRRGAAVKVLCQADVTTNAKTVRPLLKDSEPSVRLKTALALADAYPDEAIPLVIESLAVGSPAVQAQAEKYLTQLAGEWAVSGPRGSDYHSRQLRRDVWATWWQETDGAKLLLQLRSRTLTDQEVEKAQALIRKLDNKDPEAVDAAAWELHDLGSRVVPLLRRASDEDHPGSSAAAQCLEGIELNPLPGAALRLLRLRRPEGTLAALLAFLPCAEDHLMVSEIRDLLIQTGVTAGKADENLTKALNDKLGVRRAVAAAVLCRARAKDTLPEVRKLLADKDMGVRQQVAQELASIGDKEGLLALIALLEKLPGDKVWEVEEYLEQAAGDMAPAEINSEPVDWKKVASAWTEWAKGDKSKVVLVEAPGSGQGTTVRGFTLLVQLRASSVTELGNDGKPRWTVTGLDVPLDAQVLPGRGVLIAEHTRVTERTLKGRIVWQKEITRPWSVQRLRNGNTLIGAANQIIEVDRAGKEVLKIARWAHAARKLPNGRIIAFYDGRMSQFDRRGQLVKEVQIKGGNVGFPEILDNGNILVPYNHALIEFDAHGKVVGRIDRKGVSHGYRLRNGHTLVTINWNEYLELDKNWQLLNETKLTTTQAMRVKRR
jgi:HEAT repeat protein